MLIGLKFTRDGPKPIPGGVIVGPFLFLSFQYGRVETRPLLLIWISLVRRDLNLSLAINSFLS